MPCPCSTSPAGTAPASIPNGATTVSRERIVYVLVGIALGMYVVPRIRAKVGV